MAPQRSGASRSKTCYRRKPAKEWRRYQTHDMMAIVAQLHLPTYVHYSRRQTREQSWAGCIEMFLNKCQVIVIILQSNTPIPVVSLVGSRLPSRETTLAAELQGFHVRWLCSANLFVGHGKWGTSSTTRRAASVPSGYWAVCLIPRGQLIHSLSFIRRRH